MKYSIKQLIEERDEYENLNKTFKSEEDIFYFSIIYDKKKKEILTKSKISDEILFSGLVYFFSQLNITTEYLTDYLDDLKKAILIKKGKQK